MASIAFALLAGAVALQGAQPPAPRVTHGPFVGHVTESAATVWARLEGLGPKDRIVLYANTELGTSRIVSPEPKPGDPACLEWTIPLPKPATRYFYSIVDLGRRELGERAILAGGDGHWVVTAPAPGTPSRVTIAFGSCAREDVATALVWQEIGRHAPDALVLLGDTPYIDTTDLATQQRRYREFAEQLALRRLLRCTPFYATWDDHDIGRNDTDGNLPGKADAREAFVQYHANPSYGDGTNGIYTSFRRGPIEVFLLDTRWFAATEPSPVAPGEPTLLGAAQWAWLESGLRASTAPFKVIASSIVFNGSVRPLKTDHWETYAHEREALFDLIGEAGIGGVVLVAGDIHRSRVIRHATRDRAGYDLTELITSPLHGELFEIANVPHPGLVKDMGVPSTFLLLTADTTVSPATLTAQFIDLGGRVIHEERLGRLVPSEDGS